MKGVRIFDQATNSLNYIELGVLVELMLYWDTIGRKPIYRPALFAVLCFDEENPDHEASKYEEKVIKEWFVFDDDGCGMPNDLLILVWDSLISGAR